MTRTHKNTTEVINRVCSCFRHPQWPIRYTTKSTISTKTQETSLTPYPQRFSALSAINCISLAFVHDIQSWKSYTDRQALDRGRGQALFLYPKSLGVADILVDYRLAEGGRDVVDLRFQEWFQSSLSMSETAWNIWQGRFTNLETLLPCEVISLPLF